VFVHVAPCLLASVEEVTLGEHVGGNRLAVGLPIYWQIRRTEDAPDPPSRIRAGETPDGFVATVPYSQPPVQMNARYSVLIELQVADVGSMSFQLQDQPGGTDVPSGGLIHNGEYRLVDRSAFDRTDQCDPQGAYVDDGVLSEHDAQAFAPASNPLADPPTPVKPLLDLSSASAPSGDPAPSELVGAFQATGSYRIFAACSRTSIQVSDTFAPGPDVVWGKRTVVPCQADGYQSPRINRGRGPE
jgi:hypothetical protein